MATPTYATTYTLDLAAPLVQVLEQYNSAGTIRYLYGTSRIGEEQPGGWAYHLADGLGSVRQLAGSDGLVTQARGYMPYGEDWWSEGEGSSAFGFAGEQVDAETGLVYLRARYYAASLAQFLTEDMAPGNASLPRSLALYAYAWSNPVNLSDPSGWQVPPPQNCNPGDICYTGTTGSQVLIISPGTIIPPGTTLVEPAGPLLPEDVTGYLALAMSKHARDPRIKEIAAAMGLPTYTYIMRGDGKPSWAPNTANLVGIMQAYGRFFDLN